MGGEGALMSYIANIVAGDDVYFYYTSPEEIDISDYTFILTVKSTLMGQPKIVVENGPSDHTDAHNTTFHLSKQDTAKLSAPEAWIEIRYCDGNGSVGSVKLGDKDGPQKVSVSDSLVGEIEC